MKRLALVLSFIVTACGAMRPAGTAAIDTRAALRIDAESGVAEWVTVDRGVRVNAAGGVAHLRAILAGARIYPIEGGDLQSVDLDALEALPEAREPRDISDVWRRLARDLSVVDVGLAQASDGRLTVWRRTRLERAAQWLTELQRAMHPHLSAKLGSFPTFDVPTLELVNNERARGGVEWRIEGGALVCSFPSTAENARQCEAGLVDALSPVGLPSLMLGPPQVSYDGERFTARLAPDPDGWIRGRTIGVELGLSGPTVSIDELRAAGLTVETADQLRARLAEFGLTD